ncbi:MAG: PQQ-binding-like beta-propeller repeat protein [Bacteroidota bacterium]
MHSSILRKLPLLLLASVLLLIITACLPDAPAEDLRLPKVTNTNYLSWQHYLGDPGRSHYSLLDQIDTNNVTQLQLAWSYASGGLTSRRNTQIQTNPLIVDDQLFGVNAAMEVFALNATSGELLWTFSPPIQDASGLGINRGFSYWATEDVQQLFFAAGPYLYALNPEDGSLVFEFGQEGRIDLRAGLGRDPDQLSVVANTPGALFNDLLILGSRVQESPGAAPGHIRAYDVRSGEIRWTFHTIPQPEEYGADSWPEGVNLRVGGANSWAGMALDMEREIVYIPTGSAAFDFYGGDRIGDNLFANCLLALNARTGERIWHFQFVRHDLWDRDLPSPPNLLNVIQDGALIPAVAQITKSGHVFIFHRETGRPLFPIDEQAYPASSLIGEQAARYQPLPSLPAPFARQELKEEDLYDPNRPAFIDDFVDHAQNENPTTVLEKFRSVRSDGQFVPPDTNGVIVYPGFDGGAEWGGAAVDPNKGILYVNSNEMAWILRMGKVDQNSGQALGKTLAQIHCARCHGGELQGIGETPELIQVKERLSPERISIIIQHGQGAMPGMSQLTELEIESITNYLSGLEENIDHRAELNVELPYYVAGFGRFKDDRGFPVVKPPWGKLSAIDMNSGEYLWQVPLGHEPDFEDPNYALSGLENYGGPVITAGGLLFIAATRDEKLRAFQLDNGKLLWEINLPAGGYATPATYAVAGRQYLVIACGGGKMGTNPGDQYLAFALPNAD